MMISKKTILKAFIFSYLFTGSSVFAASNNFEQIIHSEASKKDIPVALLKAVINAESSNNPYAVSPKGAMGLMQLMPPTAKRFQVTNAFDPKQNIRAGTSYLKLLKQQFGSWPLALAAYNAGEHKVEKYGGIPPYKETRNYVVKILKKYNPELIPTSLQHIQKSKVRNITKHDTPTAPVDIYSTPLFFNVEG